MVGARGGDCQGRDDVVGFLALRLDERNAHGLQHVPNDRKLAIQVRRRGRSLCLVRGQQSQAFMGCAEVEYGGMMRGCMVGSHLLEHLGQAIDGVDRLTIRPREGADGVKRAVNQGVRVVKEYGSSHCATNVARRQKQNNPARWGQWYVLRSSLRV